MSAALKPVVLVPPQSKSREAIVRALARAGMCPVGKEALGEADGPELAIVDLTAPEGPDALAELQLSSSGARLSIVAVADAHERTTGPVLLVADFVSSATVEAELPLRLRHVLARHAAWRDAQQRQRDLALLLKLTADYAETLDVEELLHDVTRRLADELDIARASLVVLDEQHGVGFIVAASDDAALRDLRIDLSRYPEIREVIRTGKPVIVEDAPTHPILEGVHGEVAAKGIHNIAVFPMAVRGKVLGVLLVRASARRPAFSSREIDFLATVAHATAVALRNARQIESIQGQREREKSARIAAEERAAELKRYESYFAHLSDGVAILDDKACVVSLNPAGLKMLDVTGEEAHGRHINSLFNSTDDDLMMSVLASVSRGEVRRDIDIAARTLAGNRLTLAVAAAPVGQPGRGAILSFRDVTVARQLEGELRKTKDFLERLIDSSVDAIIAADMKGKIILFNKGAERICGFSADEALGRSARDLYPQGQAKEVMKKLRSDQHGGKGRLTVSRQEIVTKAGERVPVNMTASILYERGAEVATVGIFHDLRDRMQLERKLSDAETRLEESERNAVIVALAGTAAHELNQPLTSVMGYAELLKRKLPDGDPSARPVDIIYREAERMAEIVKKIGKITRYETKTYVGNRQIIDIDRASSHED